MLINPKSEFVTKGAESDDEAALVQKALTDFQRAVDARLDEVEAKLNRPTVPAAPKGADAELTTKAFEVWLRQGELALSADERKALTVGTNTAGGFLVPENFEAVLDRNLVQFSPLRTVARVTRLGAGEILLPKRTGGPTAQWVGETATRPATQPSYGQQAVSVHEVAAYVDISLKLLEDSAFNLAGELAYDFSEEFGRIESLAFVSGLGDASHQPKGFLTETGVTTLETAAVGVIAPDDLINVFHSLPGVYAQNGTWAMNRNTIALVRKFKNADGDYLWQDALTAGNPNTFLGRPVVEMIEMPDAEEDALAIAFGDYSHYRIFDRGVTDAALRDDYSVRLNGQVRFHFRRRVGGAMTKPEAFRYLKVKAAA